MRGFALALMAAFAVALLAGPARAQDRDLQGLLDDLEKILQAEKQKPDHDKALVARLEKLLKQYRNGSGAGSAETPAPPPPPPDDGGNRGGWGGGGPGAGGPGGGPGGGGLSWFMDRLLADVELTADEREQVVRILSEFYESWQLTRKYDDRKSLDEMEKDRDQRLLKAVGQKRAKDISAAVDAMVRRWDWGRRR